MALEDGQRFGQINVVEGTRVIAMPKRSLMEPTGPLGGGKMDPEELVVTGVHRFHNDVILCDLRGGMKWRTTIEGLQEGKDDYMEFQPAPDDSPALSSSGLIF